MAIINNLPMGGEETITFPDDGRNYVPAVIASNTYYEPGLTIQSNLNLVVTMLNAAPSSSHVIYIYMLKTITHNSGGTGYLSSLVKGHTYSIHLAKSVNYKTLTITDVTTDTATQVYQKTSISATTTSQTIMQSITISD